MARFVPANRLILRTLGCGYDRWKWAEGEHAWIGQVLGPFVAGAYYARPGNISPEFVDKPPNRALLRDEHLEIRMSSRIVAICRTDEPPRTNNV